MVAVLARKQQGRLLSVLLRLVLRAPLVCKRSVFYYSSWQNNPSLITLRIYSILRHASLRWLYHCHSPICIIATHMFTTLTRFLEALLEATGALGNSIAAVPMLGPIGALCGEMVDMVIAARYICIESDSTQTRKKKLQSRQIPPTRD